MGLYPLRTLRHALTEIETSLLRTWSLAQGAAPPGLRLYRARWLQFFQMQATAPAQALWPSSGPPAVTVVGDFHNLPRSARVFSELVETGPWQTAPRIVLELLDARLSAKGAAVAALRLVDGRSLAEALPELTKLCSRRGLSVHGTWFDGAPGSRDASAAAAWRVRQKRYGFVPEIWLFGDWHLAQAHLPAHLERQGIEALCIHQSPAPLWQRHGSAHHGATLRLGAGHRALMHTPPLAFLSSSSWPSALAASEQLDHIERTLDQLTEGLWSCFAWESAPPQLDTVLPCDWPAFQRSLPEAWRALHASDKLPDRPVLHPSEARAWIPLAASWNDLTGIAAQLLVQASPSAEACSPVGFAFQRLCQLSWNPFYSPPERLPEPCSASGRLATAQLLGCKAGELLARQGSVTVLEAKQLLCRGTESFIWHHVMSTIRAESATA